MLLLCNLVFSFILHPIVRWSIFSSFEKIPVVSYIFRTSLKLKASDADNVRYDVSFTMLYNFFEIFMIQFLFIYYN